MRSLVHFFALLALVVLAGCGGGSGGGGSVAGTLSPAVRSTDFVIDVQDVTGAPLVGATVTVAGGGKRWEADTDAKGRVEIADVPGGSYTVTIVAAGYETMSLEWTPTEAVENWSPSMEAEGAWAIGRAFVLGSRVIDRASDGNSLTFSVDVAVVDGNSDPIETLTSANFQLESLDCAWFFCATDAERRPTVGEGAYQVVGGPDSFELLPAPDRRPYVLGVLGERSNSGPPWSAINPGLKAFFGALGGNDAAALMSVQLEDESSTFRSLGPFTSDGTAYFDAIDRLAEPAGAAPLMAAATGEATSLVGSANPFGLPDVARHVVVVAQEGLSASEFHAAAEQARSAGVAVSAVIDTWGSWYGFSELAARTGGFVAGIDDNRQYGIILGALDRVLAGAVPVYRMQFQLSGPPGNFVAGGNVNVLLLVDVPTSLPNRGVLTFFDVAIP